MRLKAALFLSYCMENLVHKTVTVELGFLYAINTTPRNAAVRYAIVHCVPSYQQWQTKFRVYIQKTKTKSHTK